MNDQPRHIWRNPHWRAGHAGKSPTKSVMQRGLPMKTLDPKRLAQAGAVSSITGRRRVVGLRVVVISLLVLALLAVALAAASRAHAQSQVISAPCLHCVHLPAVMR